MEPVVYLKTVVAVMLECHGSSISFLQLQLETLKPESVMTKHLLMKVLQLSSHNSMYSDSSYYTAALGLNKNLALV